MSFLEKITNIIKVPLGHIFDEKSHVDDSGSNKQDIIEESKQRISKRNKTIYTNKL